MFPPKLSFLEVLKIKTKSSFVFAYGAITLCGLAFQPIRLTNEFVTLLQFHSYTESKHSHLTTLFPQLLLITEKVWAPPFSLAATRGITFVLFSSTYWDVSLQWVSVILQSYCKRLYEFVVKGFPIRKSPDHRLLRTFPRRIAATLRPSSLLCVKASTMRPYLISVRNRPFKCLLPVLNF